MQFRQFWDRGITSPQLRVGNLQRMSITPSEIDTGSEFLEKTVMDNHYTYHQLETIHHDYIQHWQ
jgi:hypothetical protein